MRNYDDVCDVGIVTGWDPDRYSRSTMATQQLNDSYCLGLTRMRTVQVYNIVQHNTPPLQKNAACKLQRKH